MWFLIIWVISIIWALFFTQWCIENNISPLAILVMFCPILNTVFAAYRTYRWIRNGFDIKFLKDLFAK